MNIPNDIDDLVDELANFGFSIRERQTSEKAFGNRVVVLASSGFNVRIISDRGDVSIDLGTTGNEKEWCDIRHIRDFLIPKLNVQRETQESAFQFLHNNYERISELLNSINARETIEQARQRDTKERTEFLRACGIGKDLDE